MDNDRNGWGVACGGGVVQVEGGPQPGQAKEKIEWKAEEDTIDALGNTVKAVKRKVKLSRKERANLASEYSEKLFVVHSTAAQVPAINKVRDRITVVFPHMCKAVVPLTIYSTATSCTMA